ncbi:hypothetical protein I4U23_021824 [Adineta vaga]|nr:hypothetical protein I4U23_021824 [Adineta vaga]
MYVTGWAEGFALVVDNQNVERAILLPMSPPGTVSTVPPVNDSDIEIYGFQQCMPGTQKIHFGFGICDLCPPETKNNGSTGVQCEICIDTNSSLCFRASSGEVHRNSLTNYDQADPYPESPDSASFDDVLLNNVFKWIDMSSGILCMLVSPTFWALIALALGTVLFAIMIILSFFPSMKHRRKFLQRIFVRLDLVGEGELWLGGLVTLAIVFLITFTCKFSDAFADLYPIEQVLSNINSCYPNLVNAKFSSTLQLLIIRKHDQEKPIFDMLDDQNITLTAEFISTDFQCSNVSVQQNLDRDQILMVPEHSINCSYVRKNAGILSVSTVLPQHIVTMQFNLVGPFFVGGLRLCFSGPMMMAEKGKYAVRELKFCRFLYTPDQVLSVDLTVYTEMTKTINHTSTALSNHKGDLYSGLWLPTLTIKNALWDSHIYNNDENKYLRSLNWHLKLIVDIAESKFYMKNSQEPIARSYEIVFKTFLFSSKTTLD